MRRPVQSHTNNFDAIRILAALSVLVSHHYALTGQFEPLVFGTYTLGGLSVLIFFVISGYLVTASWHHDPNLVRFVQRRALRLWPALIAVVILSTYALGPVMTSLSAIDYLTQRETFGYLSNIWLKGQGQLPGVFTKNPLPHAVNGSLWTIPWEVKCYGAIACAGLLGIFRNRKLWFSLASIMLIFYELNIGGDFNQNWKMKYEAVAYFVAGSTLFGLKQYWENKSVAILIACVFASIVAWSMDIFHIAFLLTIPYVTILTGLQSTPFIRRFGRWGDPSYGIYLIAFPIQQVIISWLWPAAGFFETLILTSAIVISLAYLSWNLVEKKALQLKPKRLAAGPEQTVPLEGGRFQ